CHFFRVYKELEGKETVVSEILDSEDAKRVIAECIERYKTDILGKKDK
ncbi:MAG: inorganic diphosphatase, partial [Oscillospiraceae bacterium]|nr:inorganic diphosphatase [Oscillospiraceae bacterium]